MAESSIKTGIIPKTYSNERNQLNCRLSSTTSDTNTFQSTNLYDRHSMNHTTQTHNDYFSSSEIYKSSGDLPSSIWRDEVGTAKWKNVKENNSDGMKVKGRNEGRGADGIMKEQNRRGCSMGIENEDVVGSLDNIPLSMKRQNRNTRQGINIIPNSLRQSIDNSPMSSQNAPSLTPKTRMLYKTTICPWYEQGRCVAGIMCNYAHSNKELRNKPDWSRTRLCQRYMSLGFCDIRWCSFAHGLRRLRSQRNGVCDWYIQDECEDEDEEEQINRGKKYRQSEALQFENRKHIFDEFDDTDGGSTNCSISQKSKNIDNIFGHVDISDNINITNRYIDQQQIDDISEISSPNEEDNRYNYIMDNRFEGRAEWIKSWHKGIREIARTEGVHSAVMASSGRVDAVPFYAAFFRCFSIEDLTISKPAEYND